RAAAGAARGRGGGLGGGSGPPAWGRWARPAARGRLKGDAVRTTVSPPPARDLLAGDSPAGPVRPSHFAPMRRIFTGRSPHAEDFYGEVPRPMNTPRQGVTAEPAPPGAVPDRAGAEASGGLVYALALSLVAAVGGFLFAFPTRL